MSLIFNITHDDNTLDEYDATVTDSGDLTTGTPGLASSAAKMEATIDDTTAIYGHKDFSTITATTHRFRLYLDPNGMTIPSGNFFEVCSIRNSAGSITRVNLGYDGSNFEVSARTRDDGGTNRATSPYDITDDEHYVEVQIVYASSAIASDATFTLWIDGALQETVSGLDIYDLAKPEAARLGAVAEIDATTAGVLYLDEFVFRDDGTEIGPVPSGRRIFITLD